MPEVRPPCPPRLVRIRIIRYGINFPEGAPMATHDPNAALTDEEFLARFEARDLEAFSHRDHIRLAFAYARSGGMQAAVDGARGIKAFAEAQGAPGTYHETMTVGWARVVARLAIDSAPLPFPEFLDAHPQLERRG